MTSIARIDRVRRHPDAHPAIGQVVHYDRARPNDAAATDFHGPDNGYAKADPHVVADVDWGMLIPARCIDRAGGVIEHMIIPDHSNITGNQHIGANGKIYFASEVLPEGNAVSDSDVMRCPYVSRTGKTHAPAIGKVLLTQTDTREPDAAEKASQWLKSATGTEGAVGLAHAPAYALNAASWQ